VFTDNRNIHVYKAEGKDVTSDVRFFVRAVVRPPRLRDEIPTSEYLISETDRLVNDILDALQILGPERTDMNHIFINFTPTFELFPEEVEQALGGFIERFGRRVWRLRITGVEVRIICKDPVTELLFPLRVIISNVSGFVIKIDTYAEVKNDKGEWIFKSFGPATGAMHLRPITSPYPTKEWLQPKRYKAHIMGTTYVYDFPELFSQAVRQQWQAVRTQHSKIKAPEDILDAKELIFDEHGQLIEVEREPGTNSIGMVAWLVTAKTPEYPKGRRFVIIANDITHQIGSFGPAEDRYFFKVTELARTLGIPRIYLSANSGARIGIANELIPLFSVAWKDPSQQANGFDYLYLTENVHQELEEAGRREVITERVVENGEVRHKITTIIGAQDGLGVECLRGSGLIAGATSRAYEDIFTITLVTCRSVGMHLIYRANDRYRCLSRKAWSTCYPNRRTAYCIILLKISDH
jgi:acetyl-CoA carboxylase/biotin carboxylase 1